MDFHGLPLRRGIILGGIRRGEQRWQHHVHCVYLLMRDLKFSNVERLPEVVELLIDVIDGQFMPIDNDEEMWDIKKDILIPLKDLFPNITRLGIITIPQALSDAQPHNTNTLPTILRTSLLKLWCTNLQELDIQCPYAFNLTLPIETIEQIGHLPNLQKIKLTGSRNELSNYWYPFWSPEHSEALADSLETLLSNSLRTIWIRNLVMNNARASVEPLVVTLGNFIKNNKKNAGAEDPPFTITSPYLFEISSSTFNILIESVQEFLGKNGPITWRDDVSKLVRDYSTYQFNRALECGPTIQQQIRQAKRKGIVGTGRLFLLLDDGDLESWFDIMVMAYQNDLAAIMAAAQNHHHGENNNNTSNDDHLDMFYLLCLEVFQNVGNSVEQVCNELVQRIIMASLASSS